MALRTRITQKLKLQWPIISAPMAMASGGKLAAEVTRAGALGLIGGGYGNREFNNQAWKDAGNSAVGIGFITWTLEKQPELLDEALEHNPELIMLSFGDPLLFSAKIHDAKTILMCQCQTMTHVEQALDAGAQIIVAQGSEAGGHGATRATLPFVPEVADRLARRAPETLLLAAGGIGDGRGIAASLMLGADGVLIGSRYWATREALVGEALQRAVIKAGGDDTLRTHVPDIARELSWPPGFDIRVLRNKLMEEFHHRLDALTKAEIASLLARYRDGGMQNDIDEAGIVVGEITGLINDLPGARELTTRLGKQTQSALARSTEILV